MMMLLIILYLGLDCRVGALQSLPQTVQPADIQAHLFGFPARGHLGII